MKFKRITTCLFLSLLSFPFLYGQQHDDHLGPLQANPALVNYTRQMKSSHRANLRLLSDSIVRKLPFLDDFSTGGPYPNDSLWMDNGAYINNTYAIWPPTIGVATLDGVNNEGQPYNPSCPPDGSEPADSLTSRPINLTYDYRTHSTLAPIDSVYLSFYWQAGGRGLDPQTSDTLLLQFRTTRTPWTTMWYQLGYSPDPNTDSGFHRVMIALTDTMQGILDSVRLNAFDPHFQFRFKNYACTSADADQWNIDEVYMDEHRTYKDTSIYDVAFVYQSQGILANYRYMPWEQYTANDIADTLYTMQRNNTSAPQQIDYHLVIPAGNYIDSARDNVNGGSASNVLGLTHIPLKSKFTYSPLAGPTDIRLKQYFSFTGDLIPSNDTIRFDQIFSNYYAYDDSTAEASYFITSLATPIYLAEKITLNNPDTLRGLELYFNYMFVNPANYNMILAVWGDNNGSPDNLIWENNDTDVTAPRVSDTLNGFTYYPFITPPNNPLVFSAGQTIYVGWVQTNGDSLNIGFDRNTNSENEIFYWDNTYPTGNWQISSFQGSIMMRPVFGHAHSHAPVPAAVQNTDAPTANIGLYPNPANNSVMLSSYMPANTALKIIGVDGRVYMSNNNFYGNSINTSTLSSGVYIVEITTQSGQISYQKLVIAR